ncbi:MAG: hypothetical protein ACPG5T_05705 [Endozoicomonas sp.]
MRVEVSNGIRGGMIAVMALGLLAVVNLPLFFDRLSLEQSGFDESSIDGNSTDEAGQQVFSYCDTFAGCRVQLDDGVATLSIHPASLPVGQPLQVDVNLSGMAARKVTMEFIGRDMPMGLMPFTLSPQGNNGATGEQYSGMGRVDFCTSDPDMAWLARLKIETSQAIKTIVFELDTGQTG